MNILSTIIPIFIVVIVGWGVHRRGFLPAGFVEPANRLVFYVAIPAMMFQSIIKSDLTEWLHPGLILLTLSAAVIAYAIAWLICIITPIPETAAGTFIQVSGHGNLGYIGLAVAFYYLGSEGLAQASVIAGFLMILQNILSIVALQTHAPKHPLVHASSFHQMVLQLMRNPVIASVLAGMMFSILSIPIPLIVSRTLIIMSGMALPMALLVIGASLSFQHMKAQALMVTGAAIIKLLVLPGVGGLLFYAFGLKPAETLPALILLASPTATITYIMAREMHGDGDLASATVSASTLASALTYILWLKIASG